MMIETTGAMLGLEQALSGHNGTALSSWGIFGTIADPNMSNGASVNAERMPNGTWDHPMRDVWTNTGLDQPIGERSVSTSGHDACTYGDFKGHRKPDTLRSRKIGRD